MALTREYSGDECKVSFLGRNANISKISYKVSQEKTNKKVLGQNEAYSRVRQSKQYEGEMVMPQSEFEALVRSLPAGTDPLDIAAFSITVLYVDSVTGFPVTDVLEGCEFTEFEKNMEVDSEGMDITLPLIIGGVKLNEA